MRNFTYYSYNYKKMRTSMEHKSSFIKQQEVCSWYRFMRKLSSENTVG